MITLEPIPVGNNVIVEFEVYNNRLTPPELWDPATGVVVTITDPDGDPVVLLAAMTRIIKGRYRYEWQSLPNSMLGNYRAQAQASGTDHVNPSLMELAFALVPV